MANSQVHRCCVEGIVLITNDPDDLVQLQSRNSVVVLQSEHYQHPLTQDVAHVSCSIIRTHLVHLSKEDCLQHQ
jgi:hypothetical protein